MSVTSSSGLSPWPWAAGGSSRMNGFEIATRMSRNTPETTNRTLSAYPDSSRRRLHALRATRMTNSACSHSQRRMEPSSAPHSPAILKRSELPG